VLKIREGNARDITALLRVERVCFPFDAYDASYFNYLIRRTSPGLFWVAEVKRNIVGYAIALPEGKPGQRVAHLYSIAVLPEYRRQGLGRTLLQAVEEGARRNGLKRIVLEVRISNVDARRLYESLGYRCVSIIPGYYPDGEDAVVYEKDLTKKVYRSDTVVSLEE